MLLTIFTPAYNRAELLPRLYNSLLNQTQFDFEWLIVDDGSTDDTKQVASGFTGEGRFPVRYIYKENGGKHTAHNLAVQEAKGDLFFCVDSDDLLAPGAMKALADAEKELEGTQGIVAYKQDTNGKMLCDEFPVGLSAADFRSLTMIHRCGGEFSLIFPTALLRDYPFPVFEGERFVTESVLYDRLNDVCPMYLLPRVVTVCEYQADGYSQNANGVMARNPSGYCLYFMQRIDYLPTFSGRAASAGKYWCFRHISKKKTIQYTGSHRLLTYLCWPVGIVFRVYYKLLRGI